MLTQRRLWGLVRDQHDVILKLRAAREQDRLLYARSTRNLIEQFLVIQAEGTDVRDDLVDALQDLSDEVARLEEHQV